MATQQHIVQREGEAAEHAEPFRERVRPGPAAAVGLQHDRRAGQRQRDAKHRQPRRPLAEQGARQQHLHGGIRYNSSTTRTTSPIVTAQLNLDPAVDRLHPHASACHCEHWWPRPASPVG
ncbi:MAG: hypothetical protein HYZ20_16250 [Burkholderiales bacterium]|nr:hypothetical protein [Burkholderiales bacterium]